MQEPTASPTTATDDSQDEAEMLAAAIRKVHENGDILPVTMDGVVVGTATVVAGGRLSVTLNDSVTNFGKSFVQDGGYSMAFEDTPNG